MRPRPWPLTRPAPTPPAARQNRQQHAEVDLATIHTPQLTATLYRYGAGSSWEEHQHRQRQITLVLEGSIDFELEGRGVRLEAGHRQSPGRRRRGAGRG